MSNDIQPIEEASAETQKILKELKAEGNEIEGQKPEAPKEEPKAPPQNDKHEEKPMAKPEEKEEKPDAKPDESGKPKDQSQEDEGKKPPRTSKFVPVGVHNDERHKRQDAEARAQAAEQRAAELEAKLNAHSDKPNQDNLDDVRDAAKKLAEKHDLNAEFVQEFADTIVGLAAKRNVLPKEISEKLKAFEMQKAQQDELAKQQAEEAGFEKEFGGVIKEFPDLASRKEELKQLAFAEGNENTSLRRLALEYLHDNPAGKKTAEVPMQGKPAHTEVLDFASITEDQFKDLNPEQLDQYFEWQAKNKRK